MSFSLSPSVQVIEKDLSLSIPNLPSSKTGMILRADTGPCNTIIAVTSEAELVNYFGKPTAYNYKDWFNAWNFLQYASNLYIVRPTYVDEANNTSVKNSGFALTGFNRSQFHQENMYNASVAEMTLQNDVLFSSDRLYYFNRNVTSDQKLAFSVCSTSTSWKSSIANEFSASVSIPDNNLNIKNLGAIGTNNGDASTTLNVGKIQLMSLVENTLKIGSKFEGNGKAFTVKAIYPNINQIEVDAIAPIVPGDLSLYYGTVSTGNIVTITNTTPFILTFNKNKRFNVEKNVVFEFTNLLNSTLCFVSAIGNTDPTTNTVDVQFTPIIASTNTGIEYTIGNNIEISTNTTLNHFILSGEYAGIVPAETSVLKVESGFNFPVDSLIKFELSVDKYTNLVTDEFPNENGNSDNTYIVVGVDSVNNLIILDTPLRFPINVSATPGLQFDDINTETTILKGFNMHTTVFDNSAINTTKKSLINAVNDTSEEFIVESLIKFSDSLEYEPSWINDEFVTIVLQKNTSGLYSVVETILASYNPNARDNQNKNIYATEVFYYTSNYLYCKVNDDETKNKVTTAKGSLVKLLVSNGTALDTDGTIVPAPVASGSYKVEYGTVYPLLEDGTTNTYIYDKVTGFKYDPNNYSKADIQIANTPFVDSELFDVNLLISHELDINGMSEITETRKDCVAIIAPYNYVELVGKSATSATSILLNKYGTQTVSNNKEFTRNGSYSCTYGNMKYQYDKFNDMNRWVSLGGDIAGIMANTDSNRDPWWAPAGLERGKVKNAIKLAFNPNKQNRDELYVNAINPVISITGEGAAIVFGQKTATARPSALDRINVRRLLITIEKALATAIKYALFEFNDAFTRNRLVGIIDPFLRTVKARRGVYDYMVQCDLSNNPASVIDANALVIDVYIKPTRVAEFIQLNVNITRSDANFQELIGGTA